MIPEATRKELDALLGEAVGFDVPMAGYTSLRVGGPVDALAIPRDRAQLAALLALCLREEVPHFVIGGGFNTVVRDGGLDGVAIQLSAFRELGLEAPEGPALRVRAEAGVRHSRLVNFCEQEGLAGLSFGAGIPGTIGGWITMNAGIGTHTRQRRPLAVGRGRGSRRRKRRGRAGGAR